MKLFDFNKWNRSDISEHVMVGGGLLFDDVSLEMRDGRRVLCVENRMSTSARVKLVDAFESLARGNVYRICARVMLGDLCSCETANVVLGTIGPTRWELGFCSEPFAVNKKEWREICIMYTATDADQVCVSVEQWKKDDNVASVLLIESVSVELVEAAVGEAEEPCHTLWLFGDSIVCQYPTNRMTHGWGMHIGEWFDARKLRICNLASAGFSTKSFAENEGHAAFLYACRHMKPGDFMMVSLGINDHSSSRPDRRAPQEVYEKNLAYFAEEASKRGVITYFVTPTVTVENNPPVNVRRSRAEGMLRVAKEMAEKGYPVMGLDLNAAMLASVEEICAKRGYPYLLDTYFAYAQQNGEKKPDTTHHQEAGSRWVASLIVSLLRQADSPMIKFLEPFDS